VKNPEKTIITYDDFASKKNPEGKEFGTTGSSTVFIYSNDFTAKNISFENSSGKVGQAVAVLTTGDRIAFENCRFLGNQDTLYLKGVQDSSDKTKPPEIILKTVTSKEQPTIFSEPEPLFLRIVSFIPKNRQATLPQLLLHRKTNSDLFLSIQK
jgi:hypothetical protein